VNLIRDVFAAIAPTPADLGVRRGPRRSLFVPGERGDTILIGPQSMPTGVPAKAEFMVNISRHLVPWTACRHDISLDEARRRPLAYAEGVYHARLRWPRGNPAELWTVTPDTLAAVADDLSAEIRRELTTVWLPILPRAELRALVRDRGRKGPSHLSDPLTVDLMCRIEDLSPDDLQGLVRFFRSRADHDPDMGRLAGWIERTFLTGRSGRSVLGGVQLS
jgi:hypothetical protein